MPRILLPLAVLVAVVTPALAQQPPVRAADPALSAVPTDSFAFVSVKVSKLWDNPAAKPFRDWVATQKDGLLESFVGLAFADIDRVTVSSRRWRGGAGRGSDHRRHDAGEIPTRRF